MKTKFSFETYTLLASAFLGINRSGAQVVIKDYDPDLRMVKWDDTFNLHDTVKIDIDENGINDLSFIYDYSGLDVIIEIEIADMVTGFGAEHDFSYDLWALDVYAFHEGDIVDESVHFKDDGQNVASAWVTFTESGYYWNVYYRGNFNSYGYYLPLELNIDDSIHYGWARLSIGPLGNDLYNDMWYTTDYSLVVYEVGYEASPNTPIVCQTESPIEDINPILKNETDGDDFSEFTYFYHSAYFTDYAELRIFLIDNYNDAKNFSVAQAKLIDPANYEVISGDTVPSYTDIYKHFDADTRTINGDPFDPNKYYVAYFMKIPLDGDTTHLTLSTPSKLIKASKNACTLSLESSITKVNTTGTAADFDVTFLKDADESDIQEYRVGLISDPTEVFDLANIVLDNYTLSVPITGASEYTLNLDGINYELNGSLIFFDQYYHAVIAAVSDGYLCDISCYVVTPNNAKTLIPNTAQSPGVTLTNYANLLTIQIDQPLQSEQAHLVLSSIAGEKVIDTELVAGITDFNLNELPTGIYFATIYCKGQPIASKKIIVSLTTKGSH